MIKYKIKINHENFINLYRIPPILFYLFTLKIANMKTINFNLRKLVGLLVVCFTALSLPSIAQKSMTVSGEIVDMACYMSKGAHGDNHKDCASMCIKGGSPMGVLTSEGKVYLLIENHDKPDAYAEAKKYAGSKVTVTGAYYDRSEMHGLVVDEVKAKS